MTASLSEHGVLTTVAVKHARDAFISDAHISSQWRDLNFSAPPVFARALDEYDQFLDILTRSGCGILHLPRSAGLTLDSIYVRDASVVAPAGVILAAMGKLSRAAEPAAQGEDLQHSGWPVAGSIAAPGHLEGGDLIWLDQTTLAVGLGARTNEEGIRQLKTLIADSRTELIVVPLPDYPGQHDVMHLMSLISPVDRDLAVIYPRLIPEAFRRRLLDRGVRFVEVPDEEFDTMAANVLAVRPRECVMLSGNPRTRAALERAGAVVHVYDGAEISLKGGGGPTCLTRPLARGE